MPDADRSFGAVSPEGMAVIALSEKIFGNLVSRSINSNGQVSSNRLRPLLQIATVSSEERQHQALHAKSDAGGVRRFALGRAQIAHWAKMLAMIVEAHAGGRLAFGS